MNKDKINKSDVPQAQSENVMWHQHSVSRQERATHNGHKRAVVLWFTGLSGSGKSTIANAVDLLLYQRACHTYVLDGDNVRHGLNGDLGFNDRDRIENIRRIGEVAKLFADAGLIVLTAFISPFRQDRQLVRDLNHSDEFVEVFVDTPLEVCEQRDPKGLYQKARRGEIKKFTGIDSAYEAPLSAEVHLKTDELTVEEAAQEVVNYLSEKGYI